MDCLDGIPLVSFPSATPLSKFVDLRFFLDIGGHSFQISSISCPVYKTLVHVAFFQVQQVPFAPQLAAAPAILEKGAREEALAGEGKMEKTIHCSTLCLPVEQDTAVALEVGEQVEQIGLDTAAGSTVDTAAAEGNTVGTVAQAGPVAGLAELPAVGQKCLE
ncbi:hypothetical protein OGATHE_000646 [Ogataea polymorpha]|uniref:Uncharacterized protein n=1 Tax=Ogataea polymorpha TaxID=460523 RepID=A0A9P8TGY8_9ASCO|nr:hypothetical protein OGATHE_000646 [Ogataea polymorpha]